MPKAHDTWRVLPHRPLEALTKHLWRVEGDLEDMPLKRVMSVAVRGDGQLVVHNAMALDDASMARIEGLGPIGFLLVPNGYHRLDARVFHERYPKAKVLCPAGARKKVEEVVTVDGTYDDFPSDDLVSLDTLDGTARAEGVMIVRGEGGTSLVFNDGLFNMPHAPGFTGFILKHLTASTGGPKISRIVKLFVIKEKAAYAAHLERLALTPDLTRIVVSHHETIVDRPREALESVAASLR